MDGELCVVCAAGTRAGGRKPGDGAELLSLTGLTSPPPLHVVKN
jgi:hypothetical protein